MQDGQKVCAKGKKEGMACMWWYAAVQRGACHYHPVVANCRRRCACSGRFLYGKKGGVGGGILHRGEMGGRKGDV